MSKKWPHLPRLSPGCEMISMEEYPWKYCEDCGAGYLVTHNCDDNLKEDENDEN